MCGCKSSYDGKPCGCKDKPLNFSGDDAKNFVNKNKTIIIIVVLIAIATFCYFKFIKK